MKQDTLLILCGMGCLAFLTYTMLRKQSSSSSQSAQPILPLQSYGATDETSSSNNVAIDKIFKNIELFKHYESTIIPRMYTKTKAIIDMVTQLNIKQIECFNEQEKQRILQQELKLLPLNPGEKPQIVQKALKLQMEIKDLSTEMAFYIPSEDEPTAIWNSNVAKLMEFVHFYVSKIHNECQFLFIK